MKLIETHEYRFPSWLLPALINGDPIIDNRPICLNGETEQDCLDYFIDRLDQLSKTYGASHYTIDYEPYSYFSKFNCLFGLAGTDGCYVTDIKVHFFKKGTSWYQPYTYWQK